MTRDALRVPLDPDQISAALAAVREAAISWLLIYGANDPLLRPPSPEAAASMGDNVHQVVLDESGHFPMLDVADTFNRLLIDFLALDRGASPRRNPAKGGMAAPNALVLDTQALWGILVLLASNGEPAKQAERSVQRSTRIT